VKPSPSHLGSSRQCFALSTRARLVRLWAALVRGGGGRRIAAGQRQQLRARAGARRQPFLRLVLSLAIGLPLLAGGACAMFLHAGDFLEAPAQAPVPADLIVSLGGDGGQRAQKAIDLYRAGFGSHVLITGMYALTAREYSAEWRARMMRAQGVPAKALLYDASAVNSWEEAVYTLHLMRRHGWDRVVVVSDPPHLRRLEWTWSRVFEGSGKKFVLVASNMRDWDADSWWKERRSAQFVAREFVKLAYYIATKRVGPA
jgi:uncharacterized SAM-binding protein YcdF (DUF218 family)